MPVAPITLYGIPNCDTMKRARAWLDARGVSYRFHNYNVDGVDARLLATWVERQGWEAVLNRAGQTFRALAPADKAGIDAEKAIALMSVRPSMIKRPVLAAGADLIVGFKAPVYEARFPKRA